METAKDQVQQILEILPENASLEDIQYHIYVRQMIEEGIADAESGPSDPSRRGRETGSEVAYQVSGPPRRLIISLSNLSSSLATRRVTRRR